MALTNKWLHPGCPLRCLGKCSVESCELEILLTILPIGLSISKIFWITICQMFLITNLLKQILLTIFLIGFLFFFSAPPLGWTQTSLMRKIICYMVKHRACTQVNSSISITFLIRTFDPIWPPPPSPKRTRMLSYLSLHSTSTRHQSWTGNMYLSRFGQIYTKQISVTRSDTDCASVDLGWVHGVWLVWQWWCWG